MARRAFDEITISDLSDGLANGYIYKADTVAGSAPTGGSFDPSTGVLTPPTGYSITPPSSTTVGQQIFVVYWTFDGTTTLSYTTPVLSQIAVNDVKSINYDGSTDLTDTSVLADIGATGYFLDGSSGIFALHDVIARDFDVSSSNLRLGPNAGNPAGITASAINSIAVGENALSSQTDGFGNVGVGCDALSGVTEGNSNIAIGESSGGDITTGGGNIIMGDGTVSSGDVDGATIIGGLEPTGGNNSVVIGATGLLTTAGDNSIVIGDIGDFVTVGDNEIAIGTDDAEVVRIGAYDLQNFMTESPLNDIRLHQNLSTTDPGAPTGADGLGGGWYNPAGTVPMDPNPRWWARGSGETIGGDPRIYNFDVTGVGGTEVNTVTAAAQDIDFTLSGTVGEELLITSARPEITEFEFSGVASQFSELIPGNPEVWRVNVTGTSDATSLSGMSEEFYIYLSGNSTTTPATDLNIPSTDFTPSSFSYTGTSFANPQAGDVIIQEGTSGTLFTIYIYLNDTTANRTVLSDLGFVLNDPSGGIPWDVKFTVGGTDYLLEANDVYTSTGAGFLIFQIGSGFSNVEQPGLATLQAALGINPALTFLIAGESSGFDPVLITSTVQISIPTESINEIFDLTDDLTGSTALRDDLLTSVQASTAFTAEFTVTGEAASGIAGVTDGEPVIRLVANDNTDHSIGVTFTNGNGDLTGSSFGSLIEGSGPGASTEIRITYDSGLSPSFQDIIIGATADSAGTAGVIASMIDGHGQLSANAVHIDTGTGTTAAFSDLSTSESFSLEPTQGFTHPDVVDSNTVGGSFNIYSVWDSAAGNPAYPGGFSQFNGADVGDQFVIEDGSNIKIVEYVSSSNSVDPDSTGGLTARARRHGFNILYIEGIQITSIEGDTAYRGFTYFDDALIPGDYIAITTSMNNNYDAPTVAVTTNGTTSDLPAFSVTTLQQGAADTPSSGSITAYTISYNGGSVVTGIFDSQLSSTAMASQISSAIDGLSTHSAVVSSSTVTATSSQNVGEDIVVTLSGGTGTAAVVRTVTQIAVPSDVLAGSDAMLTYGYSDGDSTTVNVSGMTITQIVETLRAGLATDSRFAITFSDSTVSVNANFVGTSPTPVVSVIPGVLSTGVVATLAVSTVVNNNGTTITGTTGELSAYSITVGSNSPITGEFSAGVSSAQAVAELRSALGNVSQYVGSTSNGTTLVVTSVAFSDVLDLAITVAAGQNADSSIATLAITTGAITQNEVAPTIDYSNTEWQYFLYNKE